MSLAPSAAMATAEPQLSLDASDEFELPEAAGRYCPMEALGTFTLLMAGHGRCVSAAN